MRLYLTLSILHLFIYFFIFFAFRKQVDSCISDSFFFYFTHLIFFNSLKRKSYQWHLWRFVAFITKDLNFYFGSNVFLLNFFDIWIEWNVHKSCKIFKFKWCFNFLRRCCRGEKAIDRRFSAFFTNPRS